MKQTTLTGQTPQTRPFDSKALLETTAPKAG
jgi:hypothetical protein